MSRELKALKLFLSHRAELLGYANSITDDSSQAEDILQEAWLRFRAVTGRRSLDEPVGYLRRVVRNLAFDGRRRKGLEARIFADDAGQEAAIVPVDSPSPEAAALSRDELRAVSAVLAAMPERMRVAVRMSRIEGLKLKDIAAHLNMSVTTVHDLVAEGVARVRSALGHPG